MFHIIHEALPLIVMLLILLLAAKVLGEVFEHLGQPSIVGELLAGVIMGPVVFNIVANTTELRVIADLGIFFLIALAGMEINADEIRASFRGRQVWIALMGFLIPFIAGIFIGFAFNYTYTLSIFIGLCLSITALTVTVRILIDLKKLRSDIGQRMISAAILNDLGAFLLLGIILNFNNGLKELKDIILLTTTTIIKIGIFIAVLAISYKLIVLIKKHVTVVQPWLEPFLNFINGRKAHFAIAMLFILVFASIAELMGIHLIIGAFFGAVLFPKKLFTREQSEKIKETTENITMGFLAPIAFGYMGVTIIFTLKTNWLLLLVIIVVSFFSKISGGYLGARISGFPANKSFAIGYGLNARGIMGLVIANVALEEKLIDNHLYSILVIMVMLTTIITPFLLKGAFARIDKENSHSVLNK